MDPLNPTQPGAAPTEAPDEGFVLPAEAVGEDDEALENEKKIVRAFMKEFKDARTFDKAIRLQIQKDRSYASGDALRAWAVATNIVGSIIDILVAVLYARDPDVSVRKTPQVDPSPDPMTGIVPPSLEQREAELFARTLELVISKLWKRAKLKKRMQRIVRSVLSSGQGWLKVLPQTYTEPDPVAQGEFNTLKDNIRKFEALRLALSEGQTMAGVPASADDLIVMQDQMQKSADALAKKLEVTICECITIDVVKPEDMQISTDVELLEEHLDADWNCQLIYIRHDKLRETFPALTDDDLKQVEKYYRKPPANANKGIGDGGDSGDGSGLEGIVVPQSTTNAEGDQYTTISSEEGAVAFGCVVEKWDRTDNHIYTAIRGLEKWARAPYQLEYGTSRFYPFFYFSIYEVDGSRAPQSLASRLAKLQDEYCSVRSNYRISRERSIPGFIFNAGAMDDTQAKKLQQGLREEYIAIKPTDEESSLGDLFVAKPVSSIDPRLYETAPVIQDMERIAGVQEAQQAAVSVEKTATEAEIQQAGFSARTTAARDRLEEVLTDLARYTGEVALQIITDKGARRIAGAAAFWPVGMSLEDIVTMVEVEITAGTTGKPRNRGDREAWATVMPLIKEVQQQIAELQVMPGGTGLPLANALKELVKETMLRMGDDTDVERFFPKAPDPLALTPAAAPGEAAGTDPNSPDAAGAPAPPPDGAGPSTPAASGEAPAA